MWLNWVREHVWGKPKQPNLVRIVISEKGVVHVDAGELIKTSAAKRQLEAARRLDPKGRDRRAAAG